MVWSAKGPIHVCTWITTNAPIYGLYLDVPGVFFLSKSQHDSVRYPNPKTRRRSNVSKKTGSQWHFCCVAYKASLPDLITHVRLVESEWNATSPSFSSFSMAMKAVRWNRIIHNSRELCCNRKMSVKMTINPRTDSGSRKSFEKCIHVGIWDALLPRVRLCHWLTSWE